MAAMKPRTGDGPLEVTKEGRGIVLRIPLEGGGRLVVGPRVSAGYFTQLNVRHDLGGRPILDVVQERTGQLERAMNALARYGLADAARRTSETLSGGQKARLEILLLELEGAAAVIVKHGNPCGVARAETIEEAYELARAADPVSAYGGVVAVNRQVTDELGRVLAEQFVEVDAGKR